MLKHPLSIESIPAIIWGAPSDRCYISVHGKMSQKEEAEAFAEIAGSKGCQVISFDLPEHGERKAEGRPCTVQNAVEDLHIIGNFAKGIWRDISLFGTSFGAYFSLIAYRTWQFDKCLFLSPILDMENLIQSMMTWGDVTEEVLKERQEIPTPMGETLSWAYYTYVRENRITRWDSPTYILYGEHDSLSPRTVVDTFAARFHCHLDVLQNGEHYFHTKEQMEAVERWLNLNI